LSWSRLERLIEQGIAKGAFPGAVLIVAKGERILYQYCSGYAQIQPSAEKMVYEALFDLSSLTKPIATTTAIMLLVQEGQIHLSDKVKKYLPEFKGGEKEQIEIRDLLAHNSGLPAWRPYYRELPLRADSDFSSAKSFIIRRVLEEELIYSPGHLTLYSDLGFILLGEIIERVTRQDLDEFSKQMIFEPLGLQDTLFIDLRKGGRDRQLTELYRVVATEYCPWRGRVLKGEVHDENAYAMGGVAGHAGLFSTAQDICRFAQAMLNCYKGGPGLVHQDVLKTFFFSDTERPLGWDRPSSVKSAAGKHLSPVSVGHLGFVGTSLWIDLERELIIVFFTNRVHPSRNNEGIKYYRPLIHDLIMEELDAIG